MMLRELTFNTNQNEDSNWAELLKDDLSFRVMVKAKSEVYKKNIEKFTFLRRRGTPFLEWIVRIIKIQMYQNFEYVIQEGDLATKGK